MRGTMDKLTKMTIRCKVMLYPQMKTKLEDEIGDMGEPSTAGGASAGKSSARKSNGFDEKLASIMSREDYLWCKSIESAVNYFQERGQDDVVKAVSELYWKSGRNADGVAMMLHVSRAQVYLQVDRLLNVVHKFAIKSGLVAIK